MGQGTFLLIRACLNARQTALGLSHGQELCSPRPRHRSTSLDMSFSQAYSCTKRTVKICVPPNTRSIEQPPSAPSAT